MYLRSGFSEYSNEISNNTGSASELCCTTAPNSTITTSQDIITITQPPNPLSDNLASILDDTGFDFFSDAKIIAGDGREVSVHRCILSARSSFFKDVFKGNKETTLQLKEVAKDYDVGFEALNVVLRYLYCERVEDHHLSAKDVCVCVDDDCLHFGCWPVVDFMLQLLYASFTFQISELLALYQVRIKHFIDAILFNNKR